jgi:polyferredoxin
MSNTTEIKDTETYRDSIATVDEQGKRKWIYPKKPKGNFYDRRTWVSYGLLLILFGLPFVRINGEPFILLNIIQRKFILLGIPFTPQDFYIFALVMITGVLFIALFTVVFGRLFCGWVCPQTIFMEMVFRKIEYKIEGDANAQRRLNAAPWNADKIRKKTLKHVIFMLISAVIAHTFLSYIIGSDIVWETISSPPSENFSTFSGMVIFTGVFYGVFAYMREQVCVAICPYGRLQGVLTDKNTINVMYDWVRGEPRGKISKKKKKTFSIPKKEKEHECKSTCVNCRTGGSCADDILGKIEKEVANAVVNAGTPIITETVLELPTTAKKQIDVPIGDCIDCKLCVQVCPTGIDIRNGTQLECIHCTACMDACDEVMIKIGREPGLIRYDSYNGIVEKKKKIFTPRAIAYSVVLGLLLILNTGLLLNRTSMDVLLLRTPGMLYQETDDGMISNLYNYQIINKSGDDKSIQFRLADVPGGKIRTVGISPEAMAGEQTKGSLFIDLPLDFLTERNPQIEVEIWSGDKKLQTVKTGFFAPIN